jgi:hypothetical protein
MARDDNPTKLAIIKQWDAWAKRYPTDAKVSGGAPLYSYLKRERPDLLFEFKMLGDKWQTIHAWLLSARRVKEWNNQPGGGWVLPDSFAWIHSSVICGGLFDGFTGVEYPAAYFSQAA